MHCKGGLSGNLFKAILLFLVFACVAVIVSYWTGFFFLSTPLILAVSFPSRQHICSGKNSRLNPKRPRYKY